MIKKLVYVTALSLFLLTPALANDTCSYLEPSCERFGRVVLWNATSESCECEEDYCAGVECVETLCAKINGSDYLKYNGTCNPDTGECEYELELCENGCYYVDENNRSLGYACVNENNSTNSSTNSTVTNLSENNSTVENACPGVNCSAFNRVLNASSCTCYKPEQEEGNNDSLTLITSNQENNSTNTPSLLTAFLSAIPPEVSANSGLGLVVIVTVLVLIIFFFTDEEAVNEFQEFDELFKNRKNKSLKKEELSASQVSREVEKKIYEEVDGESIPQTSEGEEVYGE